MKLVLLVCNFVVTMLILLAMTVLFPEHVKIDGFWNYVLSVLVLGLIEFVVYKIGAFITAIGIVVSGCLALIIGILMILFAKVIALYLMDALLTGFTMEGFWIKVLTAIACSVLTIAGKKCLKDS